MSDRANRLLLFVVGVVLIGAGAAGLAARNGNLHVDQPRQIYFRAKDAVTDAPQLWVPVFLVVSLLLVVTGLWLMRRELIVRPGPSLPTVVLARDPTGRTEVKPAAIEDALEDDLERIGGVTRSRVRLIAFSDTPEVLVRLTATHSADLARIRAEAAGAYGRLTQALGVSDIRADLRLRLTSRGATRVR